MAKETTAGKIKITLVKSGIGYDRRVRETIKSLGLGKLRSSAVQVKTPDILGKVRRISHLVIAEDIPSNSVQ
ncbi:MAG: 50S ribosomal protein L30 [Peptococcaceae bacterium]|jgi:large subunit ribosomal protein L30|nr:50S ribosomal protein L30 [Peptococcaceae bacterium]